MPQPRCEIQYALSCHGQVVRKVTGTRKGSPVFYCCLGCLAYLSRQGVKLKEVKSVCK